MARYKISELLPKKNDELRGMTRHLKNGKLYYGDELLFEDKDISKFYIKVLSFFAEGKIDETSLKEVLGKTWSANGDKVNDRSVMRQVPGTQIWVDTTNNNESKYSKMIQCFGKYKEQGNDIELYEFELETSIGDEKENAGENALTEKNIGIIIRKALETNKQIIFTGAPGTGKTYSVRKYVKEVCSDDEGSYKFVQFHPSYDYSDFVEGLRPVVIKGQEEPTFVRMDGVFKEFCRHIVEEKDAEKRYYFIVDEINRADLAKVFGELMFGLEESYRGENNKFDTQYKNLVTYRIICKEEVDNSNITARDIGKAVPIENDVFKEGFFIPENLYFIGTMNDIDRSVDSMDFALRRRFQWVDIKANEIMRSSLHSILDKDNTDINSDKYKIIEELTEKVIKMNEVISDNIRFGLSEAYHIGPAYFKNIDPEDEYSLYTVFETNIVSILKEYTRGRKSNEVDEWIERCRKALFGEE